MNNGLNLGRTTSRRNPKTTNMVTLCLIWMMGVILGHFHGQLILTSSSPVDVDMMSITTAVAAAASSPPSRHDGWDSIDIFYGSKDSLERTLPQDDTLQQQLLWSSQAGQDEVIMSLLRNKTGGYFVDLAANHATHLSNTYMLETRFGWSGLCIEPNPMYWEDLAYRDCQVVAAVVGSARMEQVHFRFDAGDHGGIVGSGFDNGPKFKSTSSVRYTVTLDEILTRFHAPRHIDYLSLDVEGAEEYIMKNFPFDKYRISIMTTERPSDQLRELFNLKGFRKLVRMTRWGEIMWAHESVWNSLDMSVLDRIDEIKAVYAKKYT